MNYITEERGGWDKWSDGHNAVIGLELDTGKRIETTFIGDFFMDTEGNTIKVELPQRPRYGGKISVERTKKTNYGRVSVGMDELEKHMNQEKRIIFFNELTDADDEQDY